MARKSKKGRVVTVDEGAGLALLEEGMYQVELIEIRDVETMFGQSWRWIFDVTEMEEETLVSGVTSQRMSTRSKAYAWASALLQRRPEPGEEIDLDDLIGLQALAELRTRTLRDGTEVSNVVDLKPLPKEKTEKPKNKRKAKKREEKEEEEEEEEELEDEVME